MAVKYQKNGLAFNYASKARENEAIALRDLLKIVRSLNESISYDVGIMKQLFQLIETGKGSAEIEYAFLQLRCNQLAIQYCAMKQREYRFSLREEVQQVFSYHLTNHYLETGELPFLKDNGSWSEALVKASNNARSEAQRLIRGIDRSSYFDESIQETENGFRDCMASNEPNSWDHYWKPSNNDDKDYFGDKETDSTFQNGSLFKTEDCPYVERCEESKGTRNNGRNIGQLIRAGRDAIRRNCSPQHVENSLENFEELIDWIVNGLPDSAMVEGKVSSITESVRKRANRLRKYMHDIELKPDVERIVLGNPDLSWLEPFPIAKVKPKPETETKPEKKRFRLFNRKVKGWKPPKKRDVERIEVITDSIRRYWLKDGTTVLQSDAK